MPKIRCVVHEDRNEAMRIGLGSNKHGLPLNGGDKKRCIEIAVKEFPDWSNRRIADLIGCSSKYVDKIVNTCELRTSSHVVGKDNKMYPRREPSEKTWEDPLGEPNEQQEPMKPVRKQIRVDDMADRTEVPKDRILDELKAAWELPQEDNRRAIALTGVVETMMRDSFTGDHRTVIKSRLQFMKVLFLMVQDFGTTPRNAFCNSWLGR